MASRHEVLHYLDKLLSSNSFKDYCPNGLQIAGQTEVNHVVSGVSANQALIDAAIELNADTLLVHHGFFWRGENPCITGIKRNRIAALLKHNINLFAYHLPLDAHPTLGNNSKLAELLSIRAQGEFAEDNGPALARYGELPTALSAAAFSDLLTRKLGQAPLHIEGRSNDIKTVAWCTGAAQDFLEDAVAYHIDAYITGEISERTVALAREYGVHFFAAGHHATERYGVQALGEHLTKKFTITHQFIDIANPV